VTAPLTKSATDHSSDTAFAFSFFCDRCGKEWRSPSIPFSQGGFTEVEKSEALCLLWANEHRAAYEGAYLQALMHFNNCRRCGNWVCDDCFYLSHDEQTDVCLDCHSVEAGQSAVGSNCHSAEARQTDVCLDCHSVEAGQRAVGSNCHSAEARQTDARSNCHSAEVRAGPLTQRAGSRSEAGALGTAGRIGEAVA
jgi:hypothetical protein